MGGGLIGRMGAEVAGRGVGTILFPEYVHVGGADGGLFRLALGRAAWREAWEAWRVQGSRFWSAALVVPARLELAWSASPDIGCGSGC